MRSTTRMVMVGERMARLKSVSKVLAMYKSRGAGRG
jgi:hypothetical protein